MTLGKGVDIAAGARRGAVMQALGMGLSPERVAQKLGLSLEDVQTAMTEPRIQPQEPAKVKPVKPPQPARQPTPKTWRDCQVCHRPMVGAHGRRKRHEACGKAPFEDEPTAVIEARLAAEEARVKARRFTVDAWAQPRGAV